MGKYVKLDNLESDVKHLERMLSEHKKHQEQYKKSIDELSKDKMYKDMQGFEAMGMDMYEEMKGFAASLRYERKLQTLNNETIDRFTKELVEKRKLFKEQQQRIDEYARMH